MINMKIERRNNMGVRYNSEGMQQTINEISREITNLEDELKEVQQIKQSMQNNLSGEEANQAYAKLEEMEKSLQQVIETQNENRKNLMEKKQGFDDATVGLQKGENNE